MNQNVNRHSATDRCPEQSLLLTFDDGPDAEWTPRILDLLAAAGTPATFFVIGALARTEVALVRRVVAEGHTVGNHTWSHRHPLVLSDRRAREEVAKGAQALADVLGNPVRHFRPPHGRVRKCMVDEAAMQGQALVLWTVSAIDWGPFGRASSIARRLRSVGPGDVVLMHDGNRGINRTAELVKVLPQFLADLHRRRLQAAVPIQ